MRNNFIHLKIQGIGQTSLFLLFSFFFLLFTSCEVDFSPNADWQETPVVYCLLDQDDDTTWVRVERCYLSEGNIYAPAQIADSINYPEGSLQIALLAIKNGNVMDSIGFTYTLRQRDEGNFAAGMQPIYYAPTRNRLRDDCFYRLIVRRAVADTVIAWAETPLVVKKDNNVITKPDKVFLPCRVEWRSLSNARLYQPMLRFLYCVVNEDETVDTLHLDLNMRDVRGDTLDKYSVELARQSFLSTVYEALKDDPRKKYYPKIFEVYLNACSEDLNVYLNSISNGGNIAQAQDIYTNIHGGVGVFAARRTHIYRRVPGDASDVPGKGLYALLMDLGVGFVPSN